MFKQGKCQQSEFRSNDFLLHFRSLPCRILLLMQARRKITTDSLRTCGEKPRFRQLAAAGQAVIPCSMAGCGKDTGFSDIKTHKLREGENDHGGGEKNLSSRQGLVQV